MNRQASLVLELVALALVLANVAAWASIIGRF
jgi:hypothetical protein